MTTNVTEMGESGISFRFGGPLSKDEEVPGHAHNFDHVTIIAHGSMKIDLLDAYGEVKYSTIKHAAAARNCVLIKAGAVHRLTALADGTTYICAYANRDETGKQTDYFTGWEPAYT